jgi:hypothetical protein
MKVGTRHLFSYLCSVPKYLLNTVMPEGEKNWAAVVIGGDNLPFPSWNRVN